MPIEKKGAAGAAAGAAIGSVVPGIGTGEKFGTFPEFFKNIFFWFFCGLKFLVIWKFSKTKI